ncbi:hypothetical protein [Rhodopseudomonas sp. RCAM05734]
MSLYAIKLQARDSIAHDIVPFGNALLDHPIEPLQLIGRAHNFSL